MREHRALGPADVVEEQARLCEAERERVSDLIARQLNRLLRLGQREFRMDIIGGDYWRTDRPLIRSVIDEYRQAGWAIEWVGSTAMFDGGKP